MLIPHVGTKLGLVVDVPIAVGCKLSHDDMKEGFQVPPGLRDVGLWYVGNSSSHGEVFPDR